MAVDVLTETIIDRPIAEVAEHAIHEEPTTDA